MTWKPCPRVEMDLHTLPLDPRQGYLLSLLDGSQDLPTLAAILNTEEAEILDMLEALVACGAVEPERGGFPTPAPDLAAAEPAVADAEAEAPRPLESATHRQLFEQRLHARPVDERVALAHQAQEPELSALCFDPAAEVIRALLENPRVGLLQARLIAAHHRTAAGLEALGARTAPGHGRRRPPGPAPEPAAACGTLPPPLVPQAPAGALPGGHLPRGT